MSAVANPIKTPAAAVRDAHAAVPMRTLIEVELRKMVDTRAGRWLLIGVGAILVVVLGVAVITGDHHVRSFTNLASVAQLPLSILLPVLGVLAATSEWTQRTVLTTFSIVPSRSRVLTAKISAAMVLAVAATAFAVFAAAVAALLAPLAGDTTPSWGLSFGALGQMLVYQELCMLLGVALGTVLLNSSLAIVLYFVLPTVWGALTDSITSLHSVQNWADTGTSWIRLLEPDTGVSSTNWAQILVTAAVWIVLPLSIGLTRVLRKEVD